VAKVSGFPEFTTLENVHSDVREECQHSEIQVPPEIKND
jgi:hypothetical protein